MGSEALKKHNLILCLNKKLSFLKETGILK